jgi:glyoxylase-like metal-dependent hydrolase (beta-lactamase superfamily II)
MGDLEITLCSDGPFLLDGGAMFGVVPKTLWSQRAPADANNNLLLGLNTTVIRSANATVLIETGIGNKQSAKMRAIHQNHERLPASLRAAGIHLAEVTHVINTHLHFDHCGWNTTLHPDGSVTPTFPNARYFASAGELAHGRLQLDRDRVSYLGPNYDPLIRSGQLTLIDPGGRDAFTPTDPRLTGPEPLPPIPIQTELAITPEVSVECFPGHTETMLAVHIHSTSHGVASQHACYISDLIPTHNHLDPTWVMGFDLDPVTCIAQRKRFLSQAIPNNWLVLFTHDHQLPAAHIRLNEKGRPVARAPQDI